MAAQPVRGFRAGHDSVLLAAAVPARAGDAVLELGSGVGIASLCFAVRVAGCAVTGIEIDPELVRLANENAERNGLADRVRFSCGNVLDAAYAAAAFDHVFLNPPFHPLTGRPSANAGRAKAMHDDDEALTRWTALALQWVKEHGTVTVIMRADRFEEWRAGVACGVTMLPLAPRQGENPKRVIAIARPADAPGLKRMEPLVLHRGDGGPTEGAERVLRHCEALPMR